MSESERTFHLFPKLPVELQLAVWRECLPYRVLELDHALDEIVFETVFPIVYDFLLSRSALPCDLQRSQNANGLPPVISRVCRTSRAVALENGGIPEYCEDIPIEDRWSSSTMMDYWQDTVRDSVHLNWTPSYGADYISNGDPLRYLAWEAGQVPRGGSFMFDYIHDGAYQPPVSEKLEVFKRLPSWKVVMRVIVVHTDPRTGARSGLFGLLGDARVQLVDIFDEAKVDSFFNFAVECEGKGDVDVKRRQKFLRASPNLVEKELKDAIIDTFGSTEVLPPMYPVFMFRLCTELCNFSVEKQEEIPYIAKRNQQVRERERQKAQRGRDRGRT